MKEKLHEEAKEELETNPYSASNTKPIFTVRDENGKEVASLFDNGMASVSKFGYSANTYYESAKSKVEKEAYERGWNDILSEVGRITKTELGTWAKESIGAKAVESVIEALKALKK